MLKRLLLICACWTASKAGAQDSALANKTTQAAIHEAVTSYHLYTDKQSRLYRGIEYFGYSPSIEGIPFFLENTWQRGHIVYDNIAYDTVLMMYDLVKDRIVILHYNGFYRLSLFGEKIKEFSFLDHHFVRLEHDSLRNSAPVTGFYDMLYTGNVSVVVRRSKFIEETVREQVERKFITKDRFYIRTSDGVFHTIGTKGSLLSQLKDHSREVKQHLRRNKLRFRQEKEKTILQAVTFYDSLKK
jgi:hypothetical protein